MKIAVLGTGMVGTAIAQARRPRPRGHDGVARRRQRSGTAWAAEAGERGLARNVRRCRHGRRAVLNCTAGAGRSRRCARPASRTSRARR